jgi:gliding motility-associated lipoprotein GldD
MKKGNNPARWGALLALACLSACDSYVPTPRPWAYPRIDLPPALSYQAFSQPNCPFTFEYPAEGRILRASEDSCWVDIGYERFGLVWHITYRDIPASGKPPSAHAEDYRRLIYKHSKKATNISATPASYPAGSGIWYEISGNVGTPAQVFLSDSASRHAFMMSFYFQTALKNDSLQPVIEFMKEEVQRMLGTLRWKEPGR